MILMEIQLVRIFQFIILIFLSSDASAQTTFSFANLSWGESVETVESKLKAANFSGFSIIEKLKCKMASVCSCNFSGASIKNGWATFENGALSQISVNVYDRSAIEAKLRQKYGPPLPMKDRSHSSVLTQSEELLTSRWVSPRGEALSINSIGHVTYTSGSSKDRAKSETSAF